jgi:predicted RNase H-like HicB family nuclease
LGAKTPLTAAFVEVPECYVALVGEFPGANIQGAMLEEACENLREAVALVLEANREPAERSLQGRAATREPFALPA